MYAFWPVNVGSDEFSMGVCNGDFFVSYGQLRTYVDGKVDRFDHLDADTWSTLWFEAMRITKI